MIHIIELECFSTFSLTKIHYLRREEYFDKKNLFNLFCLKRYEKLDSIKYDYRSFFKMYIKTVKFNI